MVVPALTDFSRALTHPLDVVQDVFSKDGSNSTTFVVDVQQHFDAIFQTDELRNKVPFITPSLIAQQKATDGTATPKLVRWRCMLQDTSLGNEVLSRQFRTSEAVRSGLFGAAAHAPPALDAPGDGGFASMITMCGVSLPGQTAWARQVDEEGASSETGEEPAPASAIAPASTLADKLPRGEGFAVLLKVYDEDLAEKLHVAHVVEVLGVLDQSALPSADWTTMGSNAADEGANSAAQVTHPTLHVISLHQDKGDDVKDVDYANEASSARQALVDLLSKSVGGDALVAEYLLLALSARVHTRGAAHTLGSLSLNISAFPSPAAPSTDSSALYHNLHSILPLLADQSLSLDQLNAPSTRFAPKSDADERGLRAGRLQLAPGTILFVDEGTMNEGQLKDNGIANVRTLSTVLQTHKLPYAFPFSSHEMDTHLPCVVISQGKSFLPLDVQVPLRTTVPAETLYGKPVYTAEEQARLPTLRRYLRSVQQRAARADAFSIPADVSDKIQDDFVAIRKANQQHTGPNASTTADAPLLLLDTQEDLARTIQVARLICLSHGLKQLRWEDWQEAKRLDEERQRRLATKA